MTVVVAPVVVMPVVVAMVTDAPRAVIGPDHPAVAWVIVVVRRPIVEMPVKAVVPEPEPAMAKTAAMENMRASKPAAMEHRAAATKAAAVKRRATTVEASTAVEAAAAMTAASAAAMTAASAAAVATAADFRGQPVRNVVRRGHGAWIDE
jgi:hypothetical protein